MEHSLGSGFFVSDRYIVTNHHVVGDAHEAQVASRALGGLVSARVVAVGSGAKRGTQDIAVLEIEPKPGTSSLSVGVAPAQLDAVTASGFPGAVLETIQAKRSQGLPEANFTQGIVTSHQVQQPGGIATIIHTAQIGHGKPAVRRLRGRILRRARLVRGRYGAPRPLASLPEGEAEALRQRVADMIGRIGEFATRIAGESTQKANLARILTAATTFPIEDIWADGDQPIIVNWGFHRHDVEAGVPRAIRVRYRRPAVAPAAPAAAIAAAAVMPPPPPPRRRWFAIPVLLWLAFLVLVAASYDRLLSAAALPGSPPAGSVRVLRRCSPRARSCRRWSRRPELEATRRRTQCPTPRHAGLDTRSGTVVVDNGR